MTTAQGRGQRLVPCAGDAAPCNARDSIAARATECGHAGGRKPGSHARLFDLEKAASSVDYRSA